VSRIADTWPVPHGSLDGATLRWPERYHWPPAHLWFDSLLTGFRRHLDVRPAPIEQPAAPVVRAELTRGRDRWPLAFDFSDYPQIDEEIARASTVYFKLQHTPEGYGLERVLPGGYVPMGAAIHRHLWWLRRARDLLPPHEDVYGRFSVHSDERRAAVDALEAQRRFRYRPGGVRRYLPYLYDISRSCVCVDLPGRGPLCFRLVEYLAIGSCVVALPHEVRLPAPLEDGEHLVYARSPDELVDRVAELLDDERKRDELARASRAYYDRFLAPRQLAAYYLNRIVGAR
jgi:hypothetical protein